MSEFSAHPNLIIAPATEADLPAMMALEQACFSDPWTEAAMRSTFEIPVTRNLVARLHDQVVGFAIAYLIPPEGEIADICVSPTVQGKGIGSALLNALIEGSGCNQFWLEVRLSNLAAQRLYVKTGFRILGVRKNYYDHPKEDALVMGLTLPDEPSC